MDIAIRTQASLFLYMFGGTPQEKPEPPAETDTPRGGPATGHESERERPPRGGGNPQGKGKARATDESDESEAAQAGTEKARGSEKNGKENETQEGASGACFVRNRSCMPEELPIIV